MDENELTSFCGKPSSPHLAGKNGLADVAVSLMQCLVEVKSTCLAIFIPGLFYMDFKASYALNVSDQFSEN